MGERPVKVVSFRNWRGLGDRVRTGMLRAIWGMRVQSLRDDLGVLAGLLWRLMQEGKEAINACQGCVFISTVLPGAL